MEKWQKQLAASITTLSELKKKIKLNAKELEDLVKVVNCFKMRITPHYLSLMDKNNQNCPIRKQAIPTSGEMLVLPEEMVDPCGDEAKSPIKGIVHRYPDRLLLISTYACAMHCRHCFRRRVVGQLDEVMSRDDLKKALNYIEKHKEVKEVILTGGDPLILSDKNILWILQKIKSFKHVRWVRIHTRLPVTLPARFTSQLLEIFKKFQPIFLVVQVNHAKELSSACKKVLKNLQKAGVILLNQSVLLKGINDQAEILKELFYELLSLGVKPYYLHQCDLAQGIGHFRTSVKKGIDIMRQLRGFMSGLAIPHYIIDVPGGKGKVPVDYNYIKFYKNKKISLEAFSGEIGQYIEP